MLLAVFQQVGSVSTKQLVRAPHKEEITLNLNRVDSVPFVGVSFRFVLIDVCHLSCSCVIYYVFIHLLQSRALEYVDLLFSCIFPLTRWSPAGQRPGHSCQRGSSLLHLAALPASQREQQTTATGTCQVHSAASLPDLLC